jgi:NADPH-dependent 2,4-dienoyl-CoA reductase/sulfur reductase-like enzyme
MKFVIIGGDAAGMSAASRAKRNDPSMDVTVLEQTEDVSYSACGMPYNIGNTQREIDDLIVRRAEVFREKQKIDLRLGMRAEKIDRKAKTVHGKTSDGEDFEVPYDKLLIATGARPIVPDVPGKDLPGVMALKSLEDGRRIKDYLDEKKARNTVIVGMGYIGLEMAEAFRGRSLNVEMIEMLPRLLPWLPEETAELVSRELEDQGVKLRFGTAATAIEDASPGLTVTLDSGERINTDLALMAVGVKPNSEIAAEAGVELGPNRAIAVDRALRTSDPDIFAAGDCADAFDVITGERVWVPLALRANRAGWAVADNVLGAAVELPGILGTAVFKVFDLQVARTGLTPDRARAAGFDPVENSIKTRTRAHGHPGNTTLHISMTADKKSGRLLGAHLVGKEGAAHRIDAVAVALHAGMSVADFAQCDMAYAPPFSPVWDPLLTAANQLLKRLGR